MAEAKLSMSLDDIIKQNDKKREPKKPKPSTTRAKSTAANLSNRANASNVRVVPRPRGGVTKARAPTRITVSIPNPGARANNRHPATRAYIPETQRAAAVVTRGNVDGRWQHDMYSEAPVARQPVRAAPRDDGTKLLIANLDYNVSNDDIKELFETVGPLKSAFIKYDRSGRSNGTAEVTFVNRNDALRAKEKYNNVLLDGQKMVIEVEDKPANVFSRLTRTNGAAVPRSGVQVTRNFQQATRGTGRASGRVPGMGKMRGFDDDMMES